MSEIPLLWYLRGLFRMSEVPLYRQTGRVITLVKRRRRGGVKFRVHGSGFRVKGLGLRVEG